MAMASLQDAFVDELKDLYSAETQITRALPKMIKAASTPELKRAFEEHLDVTRGHIDRLEQIFERLEATPRGKKCKGMEGLLEEGKEILDTEMAEDVLDAALIGAAQRVEHYEIAAYGTMRAWAKRLGEQELARLLQQTLDEEGEADKKLTRLAEHVVNRDAVGAAPGAGRKAKRA